MLPLLNPWPIVKMQPAYMFSIGITLVDGHLNWLILFDFLIFMGGLLVILIDCMIFCHHSYRVATPSQISLALKFLLKSIISSKIVDFQENLLKSPQI